MKTISKYIILLVAATMWQCEPNTNEFTPSEGEADFSKFVAIGDSYTAGYTDGALGQRGQEESFSYILGQQLSYVGSSSYNQPLVKSEGSIGTTVINEQGALNGYFKLIAKDGALTPVPTDGDMAIFTEQAYSADNQNFGVPGAKSMHLLAEGFGNPAAGMGNYNPFFTRFMSSGKASVLGDALAAQPTFVSLWIGGNDVLGYALEGGAGDEITPPAMFSTYMNMITDQTFAGGRKGVIANVPGIEALPYFTTIPYNAFVIDANSAAALNKSYEEYNLAAEKMGLAKMIFSEGANAFVIYDENIPVELKSRRQATADDRLLLTAKREASSWTVTSDPILGDKFVLTKTEVEKIKSATAEYNKTIKKISTDLGLAHVDLYSLMEDLSTTGIDIDGFKYKTTFVTGGVASLDGIHATGRGSAIIANAFIEAINVEYNASIPLANINDYSMVEFP